MPSFSGLIPDDAARSARTERPCADRFGQIAKRTEIIIDGTDFSGIIRRVFCKLREQDFGIFVEYGGTVCHAGRPLMEIVPGFQRGHEKTDPVTVRCIIKGEGRPGRNGSERENRFSMFRARRKIGIVELVPQKIRRCTFQNDFGPDHGECGLQNECLLIFRKMRGNRNCKFRLPEKEAIRRESVEADRPARAGRVLRKITPASVGKDNLRKCDFSLSRREAGEGFRSAFVANEDVLPENKPC